MAACQKQIFPLCVKEMLNNYKQNHFSAVFGIKESESGIWFTVVWTGISLFKNAIQLTVKIENIKNLLLYSCKSLTYKVTVPC